VDICPSTAFTANPSPLKTVSELVGHCAALHVLSKLMGTVDFTTDVSPAKPGRHAQSKIENDPFNV